MNRTIKFRGLRADGRGWAYGYYVVDYLGITYIQTLDGVDTFEVDPETVGQFIGLLDKNGTEVYEGDVLSNKITVSFSVINKSECYGHGDYGTDTFVGFKLGGYYGSYQYAYIVGNIHDKTETK